MYLEQITFPDQETEFDFSFLSNGLSMILTTLFRFSVPAVFSRSILNQSLFYMAVMVLAKPLH
jgi:hypothetical protein